MPITLRDLVPGNSDLETAGWREIIESAPTQDCFSYSIALLRVAFDDDCTPVRRAALGLLGIIASASLHADNPSEPFGPISITVDGRIAMLDDLSQEQLDVLRTWHTIDDPELRARICDLLWLRQRDHSSARQAVESYIASAQRLEDPTAWTYATDRLTRALRLAAQLGRGNTAYTAALSHIEDVIEKYDAEDPLYLSAALMELLLDLGEGDAGKYAVLAEKLAERAESTGRDLFRARERWDLVRKWRRRANDPAGVRGALLRHAATYTREADHMISQQPASYTLAAHSLQCAINVLRKAGDTRAEVDAIHRRLLEYQRRSIEEFKPRGGTFNITKMISAAENVVAGKGLREAIEAFAFVVSIPKKSLLRERTEADLHRSPLRGLFAQTLLTHAGKVSARTPPAGTRDQPHNEEAIQHLMFEQAKMAQSLDSQGAVEPCRRILYEEHTLRLSTFYALARASAFVPHGRELLFARGLLAGMTSDYLVAAHLLVPQVEHALRSTLEEDGALVSGLSDGGIQDEHGLNQMLKSPEHVERLERILGEDIVFALRGLLVERSGTNLRNALAHGLLTPGDLHSAEVCYFWWLTLRLCVFGMLVAESRVANTTE